MSVQKFIAIDVEIFQSHSQLQAVYSSLDLHIFRLLEEIQAQTFARMARKQNTEMAHQYRNITIV